MRANIPLITLLWSLIYQSSADRLHDRHEKNFENKHGSLEYSRTQFSHLMQSQCRPEADGFFGSTHGEPWIIQYGFEMESPGSTNIATALDVINEHVMDRILAASFPEYCAFESNREPGRNAIRGTVRGYHFTTPEQVNELTCSAQVSHTSSCLVMKGRIAIFGDGMNGAMKDDVLETIREAVRDVVAIQAGIIRITIVESLFMTLSSPSNEWWNFTTTTLIGAIFCVLGMIVGCLALTVYIRSDVLTRKGESQGLIKPSRISVATNSRTADESASHYTDTMYEEDDDPSVIFDGSKSNMPRNIYLQD